MLTMFGLIKKKLQDSGDLRLKYQGFVGQLYSWTAKDVINIKENLQNSGRIRPYNPEAPLNWSKSWEIISKIKITKTYPGSESFIHVGLRNYGTPANWCVAKFSNSNIYATLKGTVGNTASLSLSTLSNGIWFKVSHTSGTNVSMYYSTDGKSYKLIQAYSYPDITHKDTQLEIFAYDYHDCSISAKDIKFIHDGKLIFGKVED